MRRVHINNKSLWFGGLWIYLLALLATAPATVMEWLLPKLTADKLHLQTVQGGFWRGAAGSLLVKSADERFKPVGGLEWRLLGWPVWRGELAVALELSGIPRPSKGVLALSIAGMRLRGVDAVVPIPLLAEFYPQWNLWHPGGMLELRADQLTFSGGVPAGRAELRCMGTSSSLSPLNPFGSYQVLLNDGKLELRTLSGPLNLSGKGEWNHQGLRFTGLARAEPGKQAELQDFMRLLGREDGSGGYRIAVSAVRQP